MIRIVGILIILLSCVITGFNCYSRLRSAAGTTCNKAQVVLSMKPAATTEGTDWMCHQKIGIATKTHTHRHQLGKKYRVSKIGHVYSVVIQHGTEQNTNLQMIFPARKPYLQWIFMDFQLAQLITTDQSPLHGSKNSMVRWLAQQMRLSCLGHAVRHETTPLQVDLVHSY